METMVSRSLSEGGILSGHKPLDDMVSKFFVQTVIIITICRGISIIALKLRQPSVIFEIIGGILMGPTAIGRDNYFYNTIFTVSSRTYLVLVANIGLVFYLFIVGMELDPKLLVSHGRKAVGIAIVGMAVPFALGVGISRLLFNTLQPEIEESQFTSFYVFIGTAMSITAFPVLARILKEEGLIYTKPGALVMGAAAINDAIAWCLLILAIALASAGKIANGGYVFLCVLCFALGMFTLIRPVFHKLVHYVEAWKSPKWDQNLFALTVCILFLSAWTTALLGVHPIFGGFIFGLIMPKGTRLFHDSNEKVETLVLTFMLPIYFALSGLNTDITKIRSNKAGGMVILVCFIATIGKFVGCGGCALLSGMGVRESAVVMVLMNTRGLVELIVLNLGLQYGLLNTETFSVMVLMCLFTTFLTCPLVNLLYPKSMRETVRSAGDHAEVDKVSEVDAAEYEKEASQKETADFSAPNSLRFSVVVDKLDQLHSLMRVLSVCAPTFIDSRLSVSALKLNEPSNSATDEYIGLAEGRLIKVVQEVTTMQQYEQARLAQGAHHEAQLLPLSLFCHALGIRVNAFDVRGDPLEFPNELKVMSKQHDSDMVLFPYRGQSDYTAMLFWKSVSKLSIPVALVVSRQVRGLDNNNGRVGVMGSNTNSLHDVENQSSTGAGSTRVRQNSLGDGSGVEMTNLAAGAIATGFGDRGPNASSRGRSTSITENFARILNINEIEAFGYDDADGGAGGAGPVTVIKEVLCVVSGQSTDRALLSLMARVVERNAVHLLVLVTGDKGQFPEAVQRALTSFQDLFTRSDNVTFLNLSSAVADQTAMASEIAAFKADMVFMSYIQPQPSALSGMNTDRMAQLVSYGMPSSLCNCGLESPELGTIGSRLLENDTFESIVIVHEPSVSRARRQTLQSTVTLGTTSNTEA